MKKYIEKINNEIEKLKYKSLEGGGFTHENIKLMHDLLAVECYLNNKYSIVDKDWNIHVSEANKHHNDTKNPY